MIKLMVAVALMTSFSSFASGVGCKVVSGSIDNSVIKASDIAILSDAPTFSAINAEYLKINIYGANHYFNKTALTSSKGTKIDFESDKSPGVSAVLLTSKSPAQMEKSAFDALLVITGINVEYSEGGVASTSQKSLIYNLRCKI